MEITLQSMESDKYGLKIPDELKNMPVDWCVGYMAGYREGVRKERENNGKLKLEKIFPEYYAEKELAYHGKNKPKKNRSWMMTEETLKARDQEVRDDLIVDLYKLLNEHIISRYKLCYFAALIPALAAEHFGQKRMDRVTANIEGQLKELARYVKRRDDNAIMKWCQRHDVDQKVMQEIFQINKEYRFAEDLEIGDIDIFLTEDET